MNKNIIIIVFIFILGCSPKTNEHFYQNLKVGMSKKEFDKTFYYLEEFKIDVEKPSGVDIRFYKLPDERRIIVNFKISNNKKEFIFDSWEMEKNEKDNSSF